MKTPIKTHAEAKQPASAGCISSFVRLLGFGRSTGYAKPDEPPPPPPTSPREKPEQPEWAKKWDDLVDAYPIGKTFEYLGIKMIIVDSRKSFLNIKFMMNGDHHWYWMASPIRAEYVDGNGLIREKTFDQRMALIFLQNVKAHLPMPEGERGQHGKGESHE